MSCEFITRDGGSLRRERVTWWIGKQGVGTATGCAAHAARHLYAGSDGCIGELKAKQEWVAVGGKRHTQHATSQQMTRCNERGNVHVTAGAR